VKKEGKENCNTKPISSLLVIQKLILLQQGKNPNTKHKKPKKLCNQKNCKTKTMLWNLKITESDLRS
jgi:hypothetical protein